MQTCNSVTKAVDFLSLYFTNKLIETIYKHTNSYIWSFIDKKEYYSGEEGAWKETTPDEIKKLIVSLLRSCKS